MATLMQKDVLIEFIASTIIGVRNIASDEDKKYLKHLRNENYATACDEIDYQKTLAEIRKIRDKYDLDDKRKEVSIENKIQLKELEIFQNIAFEFKDGWANLIYDLGKDITELCKSANCELPKILQVKEKYATLRFYYDDRKYEYPEIIKKCIGMLVSKAENKSATICEVCGKKGEIRAKMINKYTLWFTACDEHKEDSLTFDEWKEYQKRNTKDEIISKLKELKPLYKEKGLEIICIDDNGSEEDYKDLDIYYKIDMEVIEKYTSSV